MHILYLTHDLSDPATLKRVQMLQAGGAEVTVAGFTRESKLPSLAQCKTISLGRTYNRRFIQRIASVLRTVIHIGKYQADFAAADVVLARNLETLAIAVRGCAKTRNKKAIIVYEVLDIHRLLLREDMIGAALRWLEGWLSQRASLLITSSPAFIEAYIRPKSRVRLPHLLVENKVFDPTNALTATLKPRADSPPWRIGWFGAIRCRKSLDILCHVAGAHPELLQVVIRGRVSHDQFEDFDAQVLRSQNVEFLGPYRNPNALADIYHDVHFSWAIDMFEEGMNSTWLLPNRLYEGGLFGTVPLTASNVETARYTQTLGIGHALGEPKTEALTSFLKNLTRETYATMASAVSGVPHSRWKHDTADCKAIIEHFAQLVHERQPCVFHAVEEPPEDAPALVVIPCLNEASTLESLVSYLREEASVTAMTIVIADGGSTDGTVTIAKRLASEYANVRYLHNPKRIQSAAVNLAVAMFGDGHRYLIRIDAHAHYPKHYCKHLLADAASTQAASVVVRMRTVGAEGFQSAVAAAQNSKLGNGGSAHRMTEGDGQYVDHGHHALMLLSAFRQVGGYDEDFSHNEDAELDIRLRRQGHRIWLTGKTSLDYYPRRQPWALFKQYRNYGKGRARTLLRHRERPKLRQLLPVAVAPAIAMGFFSPSCWLMAVPLIVWATACIIYGCVLAKKSCTPTLALSGVAAIIMHSGWSIGFWQGILDYLRGAKR